MWLVTPRLDKALAGFHHWEIRRMVGMGPERQQDTTWVYPTIGAALAMVGLDEIRVYIACHHNMVTQYIVTCTIMDLCLAADQRPGMRL